MATGFDELVQQLLYDVALSGTRGIGAEELARAVTAFYESRQLNHEHEQTTEEDLLFSDAPPTSSTVVDDKFLDAVWEWLEKHPDIRIESADKEATEDELSENAIEASPTRKHAGQRILTDEDRIWQAIAGHGVDHTRIPRRAFECLSVIAAHGPEGVLQPTVTRLTGQDKRSVPKRTDLLAENGYITKEPVIGAGTRTTLLKLKKFVNESTGASSEHVRAYPESSQPPQNSKVVFSDTWYHDMMRLLKENDNIIAVQDLRVGLGIHKNENHTKYLHQKIRKLVDTGCIRRVKARIEGEEGESEDGKLIRCVQLLRDPVGEDRLAFTGSRTKPINAKGKANAKLDVEVTVDADATESENEADGLRSDPEFEDDMNGNDDDDVHDQGNKVLRKRIPPQWTPDTPYTNLIFNIVDNAGPEGISSMELNKLATGPLWRRPLDEIMLRLTDVWQVSQPPHLRHLTIVRDTAVNGRAAHFNFRTLPHFEKAVEMGLTEWAAVMGNQKKKAKARGRPRKSNLPSQSELDEWGFPKLDASLFAERDGRASLLECQEAALAEARNESEGLVANNYKSTPTKNQKDIIGTPSTGRKRRKRCDAGIPRPHQRKIISPAVVHEIEDEEDDADTEEEVSLRAEKKRSTAGNEKAPTYDKEYVQTHQDEKFYHVGRGRYRRGEVMIIRTSAASGSDINKDPSYDKDFVDARPEEKFYHAGAGRYKRGEQRRKRSSTVAQLEDSGPAGKVQRIDPTSPWPTTQNEDIDDADLQSSRGKENGTGTFSRGLPGVYLNPPGAKELRFQNHTRRGPKPKSMIAVFSAEKLRDLSWFNPGKDKETQSHSQPEGNKTSDHFAATDESEAEADEQRPRKKRRGTIGGDAEPEFGTPPNPDIGDTLLVPTSGVSNTISEESSPSVLRSTRSGRPTTSIYSTRELQGSAALPSAVLSTPSTPAVPLPASTPHVSTSALRLPPSTPQSSTQTLQTPNSANAIELPKRKRGRPSNAELAERERLRRAQEATQTVVAATPSPISEHVHEQPSSIVKFPLPQALRTDNRGVDARQGTVSEKPSLVVKLPLPRALRQDSTQASRVFDMPDVTQSSDTQQTIPESPTESLPKQTTPSDTSLYRQGLIVKFPLPSHFSRPAAEPPARAVTTRYVSRSFVDHNANFELNIVRPYVTSVASGMEDAGETIGYSVASRQSNGSQTEGVATVANLSSRDEANEPIVELGGHSQSKNDAVDVNGANKNISEGNVRHESREAAVTQSDNLQLADNLEMDANELNDSSELIPVTPDGDFNYKQRANEKVGTARGGRIIHLRRTKIVMETMRKAGGVYPGDHEMWYPFVTAWQKTYKQVPDRNTVENVVNLLVKQKQLKKFKFSFTGRNGEIVHRHIITEPNFDASSPKAKKVQKAVTEAWPYRYLPKQVEISKHLRDNARKVPVVWQKKIAAADEHSKDEDPTYTPTVRQRHQGSGPCDYYGNYPTAPDVTVRRTAGGLAIAESEAKLRVTKPQAPNVPKARLGIAKPSDDDDYSSDDSDIESSAEQSALQSTFLLQAYHHCPEMEPNARQGNKPRRSFNPLYSKHRGPRKNTLLAWLLNPVQSFHEATGTFATIYGIPRKPALAAEKQPLSQEQRDILELPKNLENIVEQAERLGNAPVDPSDSRLYQFVHEMEAVSQWEQKFVDSEKEFHLLNGAIFINHGLNCPHVVTEEDVGDLPIEFVEGTLKPFVVEQDRVRKHKAQSRVAKAAKLSTWMPQKANASPTTLVGLPTSVSPSIANGSEQSFRFDSRMSNLASPLDTPLPADQTQQKSAQPKISKRTGKATRPYTYKPPKKVRAPASIDNVDATNRMNDGDDGEYILPRPKRTRRKKIEKQIDSTTFTDSKRLAIALALVKTLCNGVNVRMRNKWPIVAHALDFEYDAETLQELWRTRGPKAEFDATFVDRLQQALHEPFLTAYEHDELPRVDFDDLENTDWPALATWVENEILPLDYDVDLQNLPETSTALDIGETDGALQADKNSPEEVALDLESPTRRPSSNKFSAGVLTKLQQGVDLDQRSILEKSWIRALTTTRDEDYNEAYAVQKMEMFGSGVIAKATQEMIDTDTLAKPKKDRQIPGRNYRLSDFVLSQFMRRPGIAEESKFLRKVVLAREDLVNHLLQRDQYELSVDVTEPQLEALSNMVAQGHLKLAPLLPERNDDSNAPWPKLSKWGPNDVKQMNPSQFHMSVVYKKTPAFASAHGLKSDVAIPLHPPAVLREPCLRVPFWVDMNGKLLDGLWDMVLRSVLHLVVYKPGCTAEVIEKAHRSKLWAWEIELVLQWMEKVGLAVRNGAGVEVDGVGKGGWRASEWWYCAFAPEVATWKVPGDAELEES